MPLRHLSRPVFGAVLCLLLLPLLLSTAAIQAADERPYVTLEGRAVLPADTFAAGPPSGFAVTGSTNGRRVPFASQPVQGFSAVLPKWNGNWLTLVDNGFGAKGNSTDTRLRWYEVDPDFGSGRVDVVGYTELSDPNRLVPFKIVNDGLDRVLTGGDFDPESFRQAPDGTFWYGEEFGPYLLHTDVTGKLLDAPIPTPFPAALAPFARGLRFVQSPEHPDFVALPNADARRAAANLPSSRGFEGMAINPAGTKLFTLLEGGLFDDPIKNRLLIQEFDIARKAYTGNYWFYPLNAASNAIGELTALSDSEFLVIERDNNQGAAAVDKKIYKVNLGSFNADGTLKKELVVDLMSITDRNGITKPEEGSVGLGNNFSFPFQTIESVFPLDERTLLVIDDNNYPFSSGRRPGRAPDDSEFILLGLPQSLNLKK
ncbi:MAG: esterase-like activity of phytase family protein [Roseiflexaceae bacterium]|nr:esterase-like activity of phytase family protein [Roseiflexaceae bacterium]